MNTEHLDLSDTAVIKLQGVLNAGTARIVTHLTRFVRELPEPVFRDWVRESTNS